MTSVLLAGCRLVATMDGEAREIPDGYVGIRDGWIQSVGQERPAGQFDRVLDCTRFLATPGLINTHHHLYQTLTRAFPESQGQPLFPWLKMLYPIWAGLDAGMIMASTRAGLAELALSGCSTCADHLYVFPPGSDNFIDVQVEAARSLKMRFHPTRGSMDLSEREGGLPPQSVVQSRLDILRDSERVIELYHNREPGAMVRVGLAPCSPFSATAELMLETAGLAREMGVRLHTHIAETLDEDAYSRKELGVSPLELLDRLSWLEADVWLAHCVHVGSSDIDLMGRRGVSVAHCPTSNMLLGSGMAPVAAFLENGIDVGIGVDGSSSNDSGDMRQEIKQAVLSARVRDGAYAMPVRRALFMATRGGAACLGRDDIGSLEAGKVADVALFDVEALPCAGGEEDLVAAVILGSSRVDSLLVHGHVVVEGGALLTGDLAEIAARQREASLRLLDKWRGGS